MNKYIVIPIEKDCLFTFSAQKFNYTTKKQPSLRKINDQCV